MWGLVDVYFRSSRVPVCNESSENKEAFALCQHFKRKLALYVD